MCATDSSSASAESSYRYLGEDQNWYRDELSATAFYRWEHRWHWSHDRLTEPRNLQCRPRQGSQTNVCALEEAESGLIQHRGIRSWHSGARPLVDQIQEGREGALECGRGGWERFECFPRTGFGGRREEDGVPGLDLAFGALTCKKTRKCTESFNDSVTNLLFFCPFLSLSLLLPFLHRVVGGCGERKKGTSGTGTRNRLTAERFLYYYSIYFFSVKKREIC